MKASKAQPNGKCAAPEGIYIYLVFCFVFSAQAAEHGFKWFLDSLPPSARRAACFRFLRGQQLATGLGTSAVARAGVRAITALNRLNNKEATASTDLRGEVFGREPLPTEATVRVVCHRCVARRFWYRSVCVCVRSSLCFQAACVAEINRYCTIIERTAVDATVILII